LGIIDVEDPSRDLYSSIFEKIPITRKNKIVICRYNWKGFTYLIHLPLIYSLVTKPGLNMSGIMVFKNRLSNE